MLKNDIYLGIDAIVSQIASLYPSIEIDRNKVLEWSAWVSLHELIMIRDWFIFKDVPVTIDQKKSLLPCNCHKLLDVYNSLGERIKFRRDGTYIFFDNNYTDILISYRGLPVDEEGRPLFVRGTERALARYCIMNYHEEAYMAGRLDGQRWSFLVEKWEDERDVARASIRNLSRNDIEAMLQINADMVPKLGYIPLYNLD